MNTKNWGFEIKTFEYYKPKMVANLKSRLHHGAKIAQRLTSLLGVYFSYLCRRHDGEEKDK